MRFKSALPLILLVLLSLAASAFSQDSLETEAAVDGNEAGEMPARYIIDAAPDEVEADTLELYKVPFRFAPEITPTHAYLRGTFNRFKPKTDRMNGPDPDGAFELVKFVPPGWHAYVFAADGIAVIDSGPPADVSSATEPGMFGYPAFKADDRFEKVVLKKGDGEIFGVGLGLGPGATSVTRISLDTLAIATRVNRHDVDSVFVVFQSGGVESEYPLLESGEDSLFVYYRGSIAAEAGLEGRLGIRLHDGNTVKFITVSGLESAIPLSRMLPVGPMHTPMVEVPAWATSGVHYHIVPDLFRNGNRANDPRTKKDRHGGDLEGVLEKLPWIADLGITAISFSPLHDSPSPFRYDAGDFKKVGSGIGGNDAFRLVVDEAHRLGLRVIVTLTLHSTSNEHFAFRDALKNGGASEYSSWYEWKKWPIPKQFSKGEQPSDYYECLDKEGRVPALNFDLAHARSEELSISRRRDADVNESLLAEIDSTIAFWLTGMDLDGLILHHPGSFPPWLGDHVRELARRLKPDVFLMSDGRVDRSAYFDGAIYRLHDQIDGYLVGFENAGEFARRLESYRRIRPVTELRASTGVLSWEGRKRGADRWNRKGLLVGYTHSLTSPGFPRILWGDEIGFKARHDGKEPSPYPWDVLQEPSHLAIRDQVRRLISIRLDHPAFSQGQERILLTEEHVVVRACWRGDDALVVFLNAGEEPAEVEVEYAALPFAGGAPLELITGLPVAPDDEKGDRFTIRLEGRSSAILHFPIEE